MNKFLPLTLVFLVTLSCSNPMELLNRPLGTGSLELRLTGVSGSNSRALDYNLGWAEIVLYRSGPSLVRVTDLRVTDPSAPVVISDLPAGVPLVVMISAGPQGVEATVGLEAELSLQPGENQFTLALLPKSAQELGPGRSSVLGVPGRSQFFRLTAPRSDTWTARFTPVDAPAQLRVFNADGTGYAGWTASSTQAGFTGKSSLIGAVDNLDQEAVNISFFSSVTSYNQVVKEKIQNTVGDIGLIFHPVALRQLSAVENSAQPIRALGFFNWEGEGQSKLALTEWTQDGKLSPGLGGQSSLILAGLEEIGSYTATFDSAGNIYVIYNSYNDLMGNYDLKMSRYTSSGVRDLSWGVQGQTDLGLSDPYGFTYQDVSFGADGRIYLLATRQSSDIQFLAKILTTGVKDPTFLDGGVFALKTAGGPLTPITPAPIKWWPLPTVRFLSLDSRLGRRDGS